MDNKAHTAALRINRKLDSLTAGARRAYSSYSIAKGKRAGRIQSASETKAGYRYDAKERELSAFCQEHGISTPKTW